MNKREEVIMYVCANCKCEMYPKKNGVGVLTFANGKPYELFHGDLWGCRECDVEVVLGIGLNPIAKHFQPDFFEILKRERENGIPTIECR